jgi:hypothetical protein
VGPPVATRREKRPKAPGASLHLSKAVSSMGVVPDSPVSLWTGHKIPLKRKSVYYESPAFVNSAKDVPQISGSAKMNQDLWNSGFGKVSGTVWPNKMTNLRTKVNNSPIESWPQLLNANTYQKPKEVQDVTVDTRPPCQDRPAIWAAVSKSKTPIPCKIY